MIGSINALDILLVIVMAYFLIRGILHGVVKEIFGVIALIAAFIIASKYWPIGAEHLQTVIPNKSHGAVASFLGIYLLVYFLISIAAIFLDKLISLGLGPLSSSFLGAVVGVLKGLILSSLALLCSTVFINPTESQFFLTSKSWPFVEPVSVKVKSLTPKQIQVYLDVKLPAQIENLTLPKQLPINLLTEDSMKLNPNDIDWSRVREILKEEPHLMTKTWVEKFSNIESENELSKEEVKKFIEENADLFESPQNLPKTPEIKVEEGNSPSWPQPQGS